MLTAMVGDSIFPNASDFSPGIIRDEQGTRLRDLLELAATHVGNRPGAVEAVRTTFFSHRTPSMQAKSAANALIALNQNNYGLLTTKGFQLSPVGEEVLRQPTEEAAVRRLCRHIMRELCGADLLRAVASLTDRGESPDKLTLARELQLMGYTNIKPTAGSHTNMLAWLRAGGIVQGNGLATTILDEVLYEVTGLRMQGLDQWADFDDAQRAFLRSLRELAVIHGTNPIDVATVRENVEATHGDTVWRRADQVPKDVIQPLATHGWLVAPSHAGRGARQGKTAATAQLLALDIDVLDKMLLGGLPRDVRVALRRPLEDVAADLNAADKDVAGRALEVLSARIAIGLGLGGLRLRARAAYTGGNEVDLIAEAVGRSYARWLFQCKNSRQSVGVNVLAKEVGVATLLNAHVVVLVTLGSFSPDVRAMADQLARVTPLQVLLIDGLILDAYLAGGERAISTALRKQAREIQRHKSSQVDRVVEAS